MMPLAGFRRFGHFPALATQGKKIRYLPGLWAKLATEFGKGSGGAETADCGMCSARMPTAFASLEESPTKMQKCQTWYSFA